MFFFRYIFQAVGLQVLYTCNKNIETLKFTLTLLHRNKKAEEEERGQCCMLADGRIQYQVEARAHFCKPKLCKESENWFPVWRNRFLDSLKGLQTWARSNAVQIYYFLFIQHRAADKHFCNTVNKSWKITSKNILVYLFWRSPLFFDIVLFWSNLISLFRYYSTFLTALFILFLYV